MTYDEIKAEYDAALAASRAADQRLRAASDLWMAAQCGEAFPSPSSRIGWRCTLEAGHTGEHSNIFSRGEAQDTPAIGTAV